MKFTKMHGIGNDYVYIDCFKEQVKDPSELAIRVSDRHFGIGSDGLILNHLRWRTVRWRCIIWMVPAERCVGMGFAVSVSMFMTMEL